MLKLIKALDLQHWADTKESETLPTVVSKYGQLCGMHGRLFCQF